MTLSHAFLLGIIQGLTEFIPVSSTAHLLIGQKLFGLPADDAMFSFLVIVQLGTLISLFVFYWKDLLAGYFLKDAVEALFRQPMLEASIRLFAAAVLLTLAEWLTKKNRSLESMTWLDAILIGVMQIIAVFPGASRSGTTISGGMFRGFDRPSAARFAFLMSVPVMLTAGGGGKLDVIRMPDLGEFLALLIVGFVTAAIVGWFAIKWLIDYLSKRSLYVFSGNRSA